MSDQACCADCGLRYASIAWADVVVPNEVWRRISPTQDEGGLLCFNCMNASLERLGLTDVPHNIASGPFATDADHAAFSAIYRRDALLREAAAVLDRASDELSFGYPRTEKACEDLAARIRKELGNA